MKPGPTVLKLQVLQKDVCYMTTTGITPPHDETWLYVVDVQGCVFKRQLIEGRITRWLRVRSNAKGVPAVQVATSTLEKLQGSVTHDTVHVLEDRREEWAS
jgi:hypothetical protein